jgi:hypothetical protein
LRPREQEAAGYGVALFVISVISIALILHAHSCTSGSAIPRLPERDSFRAFVLAQLLRPRSMFDVRQQLAPPTHIDRGQLSQACSEGCRKGTFCERPAGLMATARLN